MFLQKQMWHQKQGTFVHEDPSADFLNKMGLLEGPTLVQLWSRMGRVQLAAASSGTHSPNEAFGDISNQQKIPCIAFSSLTTDPDPGSWDITSSACRSWQSTGASFLKACLLPANNWADRRIPQIAQPKSDDWIYYQPPFGPMVSQPSHPCFMERTTLTKSHHTICAPQLNRQQ